jgi:hypothetical protein
MPTSFVDTWWNDAYLKGGVKAARRVALVGALGVAAAKNPAKSQIKVRAINGTTAGPDLLKGSGNLARIMEGGRQGGYIISPGDSFQHQLTPRVRSGRSSFGSFIIGGKGNFGLALSSQNTHPGGGGLSHPVAGPIVGGAMDARPYLFPAALWWSQGGYQNALRAALAASGARAIGIAA